jgi:hypothetical protein
LSLDVICLDLTVVCHAAFFSETYSVGGMMRAIKTVITVDVTVTDKLGKDVTVKQLSPELKDVFTRQGSRLISFINKWPAHIKASVLVVSCFACDAAGSAGGSDAPSLWVAPALTTYVLLLCSMFYARRVGQVAKGAR